jgi:hypothetical protein
MNMKKIDQTLFGEGVGNCLPACLATVMNVNVKNIPNFCVDYGDHWFFFLQRWLRGYDKAAMYFNVPPGGFEMFADPSYSDIYWIGCGPTDRGNHCCVYKGSNLYHDPNPNFNRGGLLKLEGAMFILHTFNQG